MPTAGQFVVGEIVTSTDANQLFVRGSENRIINGGFQVNQRSYVSGTNLASGSYGFDRWKSAFTNTALTFTAGSQTTTLTISTSGILQQIIEQSAILAGQYILSFSGTATGRVYNSGGTPPSFAASPIVVTLDGLADVVVEFTASGSTKTLGTVQLEVGNVFSPFQIRHRAEELALCQRYFATVGNGFVGRMGSSTNAELVGRFPVTMRATPTLTFGGFVNAQTTVIQLGVGAVTATAISSFTGAPDGGFMAITVSGGTGASIAAIRDGAVCGADAEL